ncbi:MAG: cellobiose phosphorylase, partial [Alphaproteobacteria bacterium]
LDVEPADRPEIIEVKPGNFYGGFLKDCSGCQTLPDFIIDPDIIFEEMTDFTVPLGFINSSNLKMPKGAFAKNKTPCAMASFSAIIEPGKTFTYYSVVGNATNLESIDPFFSKFKTEKYIAEKKCENKQIIKSIQSDILTKSSSPEFDNYCDQTYLDNLLRGGYPVSLGEKNNQKNFYIYSRIHGDMEREYNNFVIEPENFSQGNGAYRDVNQNRRNDVFFNPLVKSDTLTYFINLIQLDGLNPVGILGSELKVTEPEKLLEEFDEKVKAKLRKFFSKTFSLGEFFIFLEQENISLAESREKILDKLISCSERIDRATPREGYWTDHWHYNIDLFESYLSIYPEDLENLLLKRKDFTFYDNYLVVMPRDQKHVLLNDKPRQLDAVYHDPEKEKIIKSRVDDKDIVRTEFGRGEIFKTNLIAKLICLVANKFASLDPFGVGVELETERSNWCDAMNGLPGLFGSSTNESIELKRLIDFILDSLNKLGVEDCEKISAAEEIIDFLIALKNITIVHAADDFMFWDFSHNAKEKYWDKTRLGVSGIEKTINVGELKESLNLFGKKVEAGIQKGIDQETGVVNTYFENQPSKFEVLKSKKNWNGRPSIKISEFSQKPLPLFLEGPVHYLRTVNDFEKANQMAEAVFQSDIFDKKLKMFKVNADLKNTRIDVGRIQIFTRGWLENESIWSHMEHKYLLELLRCGLTEKFYSHFKNCLVPFMDPETYGRSIFENVSFIVSSAHPEEKYHGQGFVSRLSGVTAEFISIWRIMTSGASPFIMENGKLCMKLEPKLQGSIFTEKPDTVTHFTETGTEIIELPANSFLCTFLGSILLVYHNSERKDTFGKNAAKISNLILTYKDGKQVSVAGNKICEPHSKNIRNLKVSRIDAFFKYN